MQGLITNSGSVTSSRDEGKFLLATNRQIRNLWDAVSSLTVFQNVLARNLLEAFSKQNLKNQSARSLFLRAQLQMTDPIVGLVACLRTSCHFQALRALDQLCNFASWGKILFYEARLFSSLPISYPQIKLSK